MSGLRVGWKSFRVSARLGSFLGVEEMLRV